MGSGLKRMIGLNMIKFIKMVKVLIILALVLSCTTESSPSPNVPFRSVDELAKLDELREFGWRDYGLYWDSYGGDDTSAYWLNLELVGGEFYAFGEVESENIELGERWMVYQNNERQ